MKDVIVIWICEHCGRYDLDFKREVLYCKCGGAMTKRTYKEVD